MNITYFPIYLIVTYFHSSEFYSFSHIHCVFTDSKFIPKYFILRDANINDLSIQFQISLVNVQKAIIFYTLILYPSTLL